MSVFKRPIPVLMYHRINRPDPNSSLTVSPENFKKQIDWLIQKKFRFLSLDEVLESKTRAPVWERSVAFTFDDGFRDNYENAFSFLIKHRLPAALFVVVNWVGQEGYVTWNEIRELAQRGILIGSHSLTHRWLPDISDDEELRSEVVDSKKRIEAEIGGEIRHFSYPVGGLDERVAGYVEKAGYRAAWVAGARPSITVSNPLFTLRRLKIGPSDSNVTHFAIKAYGLKSLLR